MYEKGKKIYHIGKDGGGVQGGSRGEIKREVREVIGVLNVFK